MNLTPLVLSNNNFTHFADTSLDGCEEALLEVFFNEHRLEDGRKLLLWNSVHLGDVQNAIGQRFHGHFEVVDLHLVQGEIYDFSDAAILVLLDAKHVTFDHDNDLLEF